LSPPRAAAPVTLSRGKAGTKMNEKMNRGNRLEHRFIEQTAYSSSFD